MATVSYTTSRDTTEPPEEHARLLSYFALDSNVFVREKPSIKLFANGHAEEID
jgi:hypothetical protein